MITIYGVPVSVHTRKAIIAAKLKSIPHELKPVIPFHPPENWTSLSPTGRIPAMTDGDFNLADSSAICHYLERLQPQPSLLPGGPRPAAQALFLDAYAGDILFRTIVHGLFLQQIIRPKILDQPTDHAVISSILSEAQPQAFDFLETIAGLAYLAGEQLSLADVAVMSNLINYHYLGYRIDSARHPRLARYFANHLQSEPFADALRNEAPFAEQLGLDRSFAA